jgi:hypothetical protein
MSSARPMSTLRRPMPGMPVAPPPEPPGTSPGPSSSLSPSNADGPPTPGRDGEGLARHSRRTTREAGRRRSGVSASGRWMSADYSTTRLANFRLPVDLHDHYRDLVREVEQTDPRLRRPSLTEVIIALLEEGPQTPAQVAELLRRRRAAENESEAS